MIEKQEFEGYWWLPGEFEDKVGGRLTFSQKNGICLELFSALASERDNKVEFETVFGIATDGTEITLKDTLRTGQNTSWSHGSEISSTTHRADRVFVGQRFEDSPEFDAVKLEFPLLYEWTDATGITDNREADEDSGKMIETITYKMPKGRSADLDSFELNLVPNAQHQTGSGRSSVEEDAYFSIELDEGPLSFKEIQKFVRQLQAFVTIATGKEVHLTALFGRNYRELSEPDFTVPRDIEILYRTGSDPNNPQSLDRGAENFLLSDIEDRFTDVMRDWFNKYEELRPVFSLYFSTKYNSSMYVENEFLSLTRAIESYHRMGHEGIYLSENEFEDYYEQLVENIPEEYANSFQSHLKNGTFKYANEYSLRKRLKILDNKYGEILEVLPIDFSGKINLIVDARNDLTHRETGQTMPATSELIQCVTILQALLEIILLREIGISDYQIKEKMDIRYRDRLSH